MKRQNRGQGRQTSAALLPDPPEMAVMPFVEELKPPTHFHGIRRGDGCHLYKSNDEYQIEISPDRSLAVYNHSPTGFEWGYGGSGPSQLALAIMLEVTDDDRRALNLYHDFKFDIVAGLPFTGWTLPLEQIERWIAASEQDKEDTPDDFPY